MFRNRSASSFSRSKGRKSSALRMESLEDRRLLAVTVGNDGDMMNGDVGSIDALVADDGGDGISLREAIVASNNTPGADVIDFAPEVHGTIGLTSQLNITDDLTIHGPGKGKLTVSGSGQSRVFDITDTNVAMNQLTIADGFTQQDLADSAFHGTAGGAGIRATNSNVSLEHVVMENNRIQDSVFAAGAAIQSQSGSSVSLDHVTARNNEAIGLFFAGGGAIQSDRGSTLTIEHSHFDGNRADGHPDNTNTISGGAISITSGGQTTISHSQFTDNHVDADNARGLGGAISNTFGSSLNVNNSSFTGNSVLGSQAYGGAIFNGFGSPAFPNKLTIDNSSIVNNRAIGDVAYGGGIANAFGVAIVTMTGTNVNANRATGNVDGKGGGVYTNFGGTTVVDASSNIHGNKASTSNDDVFGNLTLLEDLLALV